MIGFFHLQSSFTIMQLLANPKHRCIVTPYRSNSQELIAYLIKVKKELQRILIKRRCDVDVNIKVKICF